MTIQREDHHALFIYASWTIHIIIIIGAADNNEETMAICCSDFVHKTWRKSSLWAHSNFWPNRRARKQKKWKPDSFQEDPEMFAFGSSIAYGTVRYVRTRTTVGVQ